MGLASGFREGKIGCTEFIVGVFIGVFIGICMGCMVGESDPLLFGIWIGRAVGCT